MKKKLLMISIVFSSVCGYGQSGNHVFTGAEAVNFGTIDLATPTGKTWSTFRGATPGYFSAVGTATYTSLSDAHNVNGYVKKYGNTSFTFPVGTGTDLRSIAINAPTATTDAYASAWILGNPSSTPDPTNGDALHATSAVVGTIKRVMPIGQWDWQAISGTGAGLTVTASMPNLSSFAPKGHLRLVGWQNSTSKWVDLSAAANATANTEDATITGTMLAGIDAVSIGSIANGFPDLTPSVNMDNTSFNSNQSIDFVVDLFEIANNPTDGSTITFVISKPSNWNVTVPGITLTGTNQAGVNTTSNVGGGTSNQNGSWLFSETSSFVFCTFQPNSIIPASGGATLGFTLTRKPTALSGTTQSFTTTIVTNSGADNNVSNNRVFTTLSTN